MGEHGRHNKSVPFETSAGVAFIVAGPGVAAVSDRWKLVVSPLDAPYLFDLQEDPDELNNAANANPERVREMAGALRAWLTRTADPAVGG